LLAEDKSRATVALLPAEFAVTELVETVTEPPLKPGVVPVNRALTAVLAVEAAMDVVAPDEMFC
jgi:hypothetical protein